MKNHPWPLAFLLVFYSCHQDNISKPPEKTALSIPDPVLMASLVTLNEQIIARSIDYPAAKNALDSLVQDTDIAHRPETDSLAGVLFFKVGKELIESPYREFGMARSALQKALSIRKRLYQNKDDSILETYYRLGVASTEAKDFQDALAYFSQSAGETESVRYFKSNLRTGQVYLNMKETKMALNHFLSIDKSIADFPLNSADIWIKTDIMVYISNCFRDLGKFKEAISWGKKALPWVNPAILDAEEANRVYSAISNAWNDSLFSLNTPDLQNSDAFKQAKTNLEEAKGFYRNDPKFINQICIRSANLGELYRRAKAHEGAQNILLNSINNVRSNKQVSPRVMAQLYLNLGENYFDQGATQNALLCYDSVLYYLCPAYQTGVIPSPRYPNPIVDRLYLAAVLSDMAHASFTQYFEGGKKDETSKTRGMMAYDSLLVLLHTVRGGYLTEETKLELAKNAQQPLRQAFSWYIRFYEEDQSAAFLERAFQISEQCKAFALLQAARANNSRGAASDTLEQKERGLLQSLDEIESTITVHRDSIHLLKNLETKRLEIVDALMDLKKDMEQKDQVYFNLRYTGTEYTVATIRQKLLDTDQGLVEYFLEDSMINIFLISRQKFTLSRIPFKKYKLEQLIDSFQFVISNPTDADDRIMPERELALCQTGYQLYQVLLAPLKDENLRRLILIPDEGLNRLSFEALLLQPGVKDIREAVDRAHFAVFRYAISYCFSANLLGLMQNKKAGAGLRRQLAVFAPEYNNALATKNHPVYKWVSSLRDMGVPQEQQLQGICDKTGATPYPDQMATKDNFFKTCRENAYIHVIAHGFLDERDPSRSCVVFDQEKDSLDEDNILSLKDLYATPLNQELIGFSACKTASGQYRVGEGNMSMARGLAYSGVRSFLTTLWDIKTDGVVRFMPEFYARLLDPWHPAAKDVALADSKREFLRIKIEDNSQIQPGNWAGIVLIGATDQSSGPGGWKWIASAGFLLLAGLLYWKKRRA